MFAPLNALTPFQIAVIAGVTSLALLAGAHAFENFGGLAPCILCLQQRDAHWAALAAAILIALYLQFAPAGMPRRLPSILFAALALAYVWSVGVSGYHVGVEFKWWEGPQACAAGGNAADFNPADLLESLSRPASGPSCDDVAWSLFGISMAGYNFLISLGLLGLSLAGFKNARG